jgi:hypothetical protein
VASELLSDVEAVRRSQAELSRTVDHLAHLVESLTADMGTIPRSAGGVTSMAAQTPLPPGFSPSLPGQPYQPAAGQTRGSTPLDALLGDEFGRPGGSTAPSPVAPSLTRVADPEPARGTTMTLPPQAREAGIPDVPEPLFYVPPLLDDLPVDALASSASAPITAAVPSVAPVADRPRPVANPLDDALGSEFLAPGSPTHAPVSPPGFTSPLAAAPAPPPPPPGALPPPPPPPPGAVAAQVPVAPPSADFATSSALVSDILSATPSVGAPPPPPPPGAVAAPIPVAPPSADFATSSALVSDILSATPEAGTDAGGQAGGVSAEDSEFAPSLPTSQADVPITPDFFTAQPKKKFSLRR